MQGLGRPPLSKAFLLKPSCPNSNTPLLYSSPTTSRVLRLQDSFFCVHGMEHLVPVSSWRVWRSIHFDTEAVKMDSELDTCYKALEGQPSTRAPKIPLLKNISIPDARSAVAHQYSCDHQPSYYAGSSRSWHRTYWIDPPVCMKDAKVCLQMTCNLLRGTCLELATVLTCTWVITKRGRTEFPL